MEYDFTTVTDRSETGSIKWQKMKAEIPDVESGIVPFSTADMEFAPIPEVQRALSEYAHSAVLGYTKGTSGYYAAVCGWMKRRHNWEIAQGDIVVSNGVVPAICTAVRAFTKPGEGVIVMPPVYNPFYMAAENNGRRVVENPLIEENGTYRIDFEDLAAKAACADVKMLIFCSPHNPTGRVWTREELEKVGRICRENGIIIVCDEIHHDLILPGYSHTVLAEISEELAQITVTCTAPSKSFNIAGLGASNIVFKNKALREKYTEEAMRNFYPGLNCFAYRACETVYSQCESWLSGVISVIANNRRYIESFLRGRIPEIVPFKLEGTYLMWLDCRALKLDDKALERFMHRDALIFCDEGYTFHTGGSGFERLNIACPESVVKAAMERLEKAVKAIRK